MDYNEVMKMLESMGTAQGVKIYRQHNRVANRNMPIICPYAFKLE